MWFLIWSLIETVFVESSILKVRNARRESSYLLLDMQNKKGGLKFQTAFYR
ncbi:MAG: hypothetical protein M3033_14150 [Acidobacteriota bacterium]|nr:hypothetical protein [Acidobacteriota bacterium]